MDGCGDTAYTALAYYRAVKIARYYASAVYYRAFVYDVAT